MVWRRKAVKDAVGFIGLGTMGSRLSRRVQAVGQDMWIYDVNPETAKRVAGTYPCTIAEGPEEIARRCGVVLLSVPASDDVEQVSIGARGLCSGFTGGELVIDCSSISPLVTKKVSEKLGKIGVDFVDAPVTGKVVGAEQGTLTAMLGGTDDAVERAKKYVKTFTKTIVHVGGPGAGQTMKTIKNMIGNMNFMAVCEGITLGLKAGLDLNRMLEVQNADPVPNPATATRFAKHIVPGTYDLGFTVGLTNKDMEIYMDLASRLNVPLFFTHVGQQYWKYAMSHGYAEEDLTRMFPIIYELLTGEPFKQ
jgi:3-hydroxyisobutyrate dehydrogenase-like beta-hydroxyacid dehydrogenase